VIEEVWSEMIEENSLAIEGVASQEIGRKEVEIN
jgi:hypothetical protein